MDFTHHKTSREHYTTMLLMLCSKFLKLGPQNTVFNFNPGGGPHIAIRKPQSRCNFLCFLIVARGCVLACISLPATPNVIHEALFHDGCSWWFNTLFGSGHSGHDGHDGWWLADALGPAIVEHSDRSQRIDSRGKWEFPCDKSCLEARWHFLAWISHFFDGLMRVLFKSPQSSPVMLQHNHIYHWYRYHSAGSRHQLCMMLRQ